MPDMVSDRPPYDDAAKTRLWSHRLHEDVVLADRQNFYLVAQSLLVVAEADLIGSGETAGAAVLAAAGLVLTATWFYVIRRQRAIVKHVQDRAVEVLPEFRDTYESRPRGRSSTDVFVTVVPALLGAIWILFLVLAFE